MSSIASLREDLTHLRSVHLLLVLVSTTMLYLGISVRADLVSLQQELQSFSILEDAIRDQPGARSTVQEILPTWTRTQALTVRQRFAAFLGEPSGWTEGVDAGAFSVGDVRLASADTVDDLRSIRSVVETATWRVTAIDGFRGSADEIKRWIQPGPVPPAPPVVFIDNVTITRVPNEDRDAGEAVIVVAVARRSLRPEVGLAVVKGFELRPFTVQWAPRRETLRTPSGWFDMRFPALARRWKEIEAMTSDEARAWIDKQLQSSFEASGPGASDVGGFRVSATSLPVLGPFLMLGIYAYLLVMLLQTRDSLASSSTGGDGSEAIARVSPWMATGTSIFVRVVSWTTLALVPATAVVVTMLRIAGTGIVLACLAALAVAAAGSMVQFIAWRLGRKEVAFA